MRYSRSLRALVIVVVIASAAVGCSGSGGSQGNAGKQKPQSEQSVRTGKNGLKMTTVTGTIIRVDIDTRRFVLKPKNEQGLLIRFNPKSLKPTLDGKAAAPEDMKKGQRAEVDYIVKDDKEIARSVKLKSSK